MAEIIKNNSTRLNLFKPLVTDSIITEKIKLLLSQYDIDNIKPCSLHFERMARSVAGIVTNFKKHYGLRLVEIEDKYNLHDLREAFSCNGINLCELDIEVCTPVNFTNDILLTTETFNGIITEDGSQIIITL